MHVLAGERGGQWRNPLDGIVEGEGRGAVVGTEAVDDVPRASSGLVQRLARHAARAIEDECDVQRATERPPGSVGRLDVYQQRERHRPVGRYGTRGGCPAAAWKSGTGARRRTWLTS